MATVVPAPALFPVREKAEPVVAVLETLTELPVVDCAETDTAEAVVVLAVTPNAVTVLAALLAVNWMPPLVAVAEMTSDTPVPPVAVREILFAFADDDERAIPTVLD